MSMEIVPLDKTLHSVDTTSFGIKALRGFYIGTVRLR